MWETFLNVFTLSCFTYLHIQTRFEMFIDGGEGRRKYEPWKFLLVKKLFQLAKVIKLHSLLEPIILILNLIQKMRQKANRNVIKSNFRQWEIIEKIFFRLEKEFHGGWCFWRYYHLLNRGVSRKRLQGETLFNWQ